MVTEVRSQLIESHGLVPAMMRHSIPSSELITYITISLTCALKTWPLLVFMQNDLTTKIPK